MGIHSIKSTTGLGPVWTQRVERVVGFAKSGLPGCNKSKYQTMESRHLGGCLGGSEIMM